MSADQDSGIRTDAQIDFGDFRITVTSGIGLVELGHGLYAECPGLQDTGGEFSDRQVTDSDIGQGTLYKFVKSRIIVSQAHSMPGISRHSFESIYN